MRPDITAADLHLARCHVCEHLTNIEQHAACTRCGSQLAIRQRDSLQRSWAFLIAAYLLYLPANLLPIMETRSLFGSQSDTLLSGIAYLWHSGAWMLALVVFSASVAVPLLKLFSLTYLLIGVHRHARLSRKARTQLYHTLESIGRWSMLDVYVVAILVALVQMNALAEIDPGPGVLAFAGVVICSMLATMAFDPRLIWDAASRPQSDSVAATIHLTE